MEDTHNTLKDSGVTFTDVHSDEPHEAVRAQSVSAQSDHSTQHSHLSAHGGVFNVSKAFDEEKNEEGTIVSDKRTRHTSLIKSLHDAFGEWFGETKKNISEVQEKITKVIQTETQTIPMAEERKDVIEKATIHTHLAPRDDSKIVIENIRTYKKDTERITGNSLTLKDSLPVQKNSWNHTISEDVLSAQDTTSTRFTPPDMRDSMVAPLVAQKIKQGIETYITTKHETPPAIPVREQASRSETGATKVDMRNNAHNVAPDIAKPLRKNNENEYTKLNDTFATKTDSASTPVKADIVSYPPIIKTADTVTRPENTVLSMTPVSQTLSVPQEVSSQSEFHTTSRPSPSVSAMPLSPQQPPIFYRPMRLPQDDSVAQSAHQTITKNASNTPRATFHYILYAGILISIIAVGAVLGILAKNKFAGNTISENNQPLETNPVTRSASSSPFTIPLTGQNLLFRETLRAKIQSAPTGFTKMYPHVVDGLSTRPATSKELLEFLETHFPQNVQRVLNDTLILGSITITKNEPFIVLSSYNFDLLFTGLLAWEPYLYADLQPIFGNTPPKHIEFIDAVRSNVPTRILYDDAGNEVLVYAFISKNTVVITSTSQALSALISAL